MKKENSKTFKYFFYNKSCLRFTHDIQSISHFPWFQRSKQSHIITQGTDFTQKWVLSCKVSQRYNVITLPYSTACSGSIHPADQQDSKLKGEKATLFLNHLWEDTHGLSSSEQCSPFRGGMVFLCQIVNRYLMSQISIRLDSTLAGK